jgi:hypothetical protein
MQIWTISLRVKLGPQRGSTAFVKIRFTEAVGRREWEGVTRSLSKGACGDIGVYPLSARPELVEGQEKRKRNDCRRRNDS